MIGRIQGTLLYCQPPELLVDVNGVGYDVQVPMTTIYQLPVLGENVVLHTHLSVSETAQNLFGFIEGSDRALFRKLIKVSGVGPKMALGIMSLDSKDIVRCVSEENVAALVKIPGVGKRTAERLIVELRGKLAEWESPGAEGQPETAEQPVSVNEKQLLNEAESALVNLGYKPSDASKAVMKVYSEEITRSEDLIRLALKAMLPVS